MTTPIGAIHCFCWPSFSEEQKRKLVNRNRYKSKKTQNSSALVDNGGKEGGIDDSLLDEDKVSVSSVTASNKSRSLEDKFENFNYLNVAFISYKLTMWDLMLFSGCHTRGQRLRKKDRSC